ncbi:uracil-DNA glycosylase family protein [Profundibacter sp.]
MDQFIARLQACRLCADRFAATATAHQPRPVIWLDPQARILIAGQAPGVRVHDSGKPFDDPSGDRLRDWLGVDSRTFYDLQKFAFAPMGFCFPGYDAKGSDLPPPKLCAETWRDDLIRHLTRVRLTLLVGGYAQKWHLGKAASGGVTRTVQGWRDHAPDLFPLPHPSWRNTGWIRKNPWFTTDLLPALKTRVKEVLDD